MALPLRNARFPLIPGALALLTGTALAARDDLAPRPVTLGVRKDVVLDKALFVERTRPAASGPIHMLEPAGRLNPGDRVVTLLTWYRLGGSGGFTVTNALPPSVAYEPGRREEEVSVDGGRNWGRLGALHVGQRIATAQDVTHVRWRISPAQAMAGSGRIAYAGLVR
jgi:hypothetical protein